MVVSEGNFNEKTLFSQEERLTRRCSNCWKPKLPIPDAGASDKLIFDGEIARSWEWKRDKAYSSLPGFNILKKSNKKKQTKIRQTARNFIHLFITNVLSLVTEAFRISTNL